MIKSNLLSGGSNVITPGEAKFFFHFLSEKPFFLILFYNMGCKSNSAEVLTCSELLHVCWAGTYSFECLWWMY